MTGPEGCRCAELRARTEELARSNEELENFAFAACHDISAPLRRIGSLSQLLARNLAGKLATEDTYLLERIRESAAALSSMVDETLLLSRVDSEPLAVEDVDLRSVMAEVRSDLELPLAQCGGAVRTGPLPVVRGHRSHWRRLLENIVGNAVKFREPKRRLRVHVGSTPTADGGAVVWVRDNGIGFEPEFAREIFHPFKRLHSVAEYEGHGIGLAICRRIAERGGCTLSAESRLGRGSTFTIRIPAPSLAGGPVKA